MVSEETEQKNKNTALIIIIVLGFLLFLLVAGLIVYFTKKTEEGIPLDSTSTSRLETESSIPMPEKPPLQPQIENEIDEQKMQEGAVVDELGEEEEEKEEETPKYADLYIKDYSFDRDPKQGEEFTVEITIQNKGDVSAKDFYWEWWPTTASHACREKISNLDSNNGKTVECKYTYGGWSSYETKAVADADDDVEESDEDNNTKTKTVVPIHEETRKPDLYISEYTFDHAPKQGEEFTVRIGIYNQGNAAAGEFWWEWWPTAYNYACRENITSMVAHGGRIVTCTYTYGGWSSYATKAVADADDNLDESDESNNIKTQTVVPIH